MGARQARTFRRNPEGPRAVQSGELFHGARGQVTSPAARRSFAPPRPVPQLPRTDEASPHRHTYDTPGKEASTPPPALPSVPLASGDPVAAGPSPSRRAPLPLQFPPFPPCFRCPARPDEHPRHGTHATAGSEEQRRSAINGQTWLQQRRPRFPSLLALPA